MLHYTNNIILTKSVSRLLHRIIESWVKPVTVVTGIPLLTPTPHNSTINVDKSVHIAEQIISMI